MLLNMNTILIFYNNNFLLTFSASDESINDNLCTVEEVTKLCLPDRQNAWILNANAILKAKNCLLRQWTVGNLQKVYTSQLRQ